MNYIENVKSRSTLKFIKGLLPRFYNYFINELICFIAKANGAKVGLNASLNLRLALKCNSNLVIGDYSIIETDNIDLREKIIIGNKVIINKGVEIIRQSHDLKSFDFKTIGNGLIIDNYSWLTTRVLVTPSCKKIGVGAIVAAGSVVVNDVEDFQIVGGNPSKLIKLRTTLPQELNFDSLQGRDFLKYIKARLS